MRVLIISPNHHLLEPLKEEKHLQVSIINRFPEKGDYSDIDLAYMDQDYQDCKKECRQVLSDLKSRLSLPWGIIDFKRKLKDPMELILHGWSDYLCGKNLISRFTEERMRNILYFDINKRPVPLVQSCSIEGRSSGNDWDKIEEGQEYLFGMLYLEALTPEHLDAHLNDTLIGQLQEEWRALLMDFFDPWYGYLWINNSWSSVMLFPFDGKNLHAIEGALEFFLNKPVFRYKSYTGALQYRLVLHLANTPFHKRENTANLISKSLNDLFHIGMYHAEKGGFYLTEEARAFLPPSLDSFLDKSSPYEGRKVYPFRKCHRGDIP